MISMMLKGLQSFNVFSNLVIVFLKASSLSFNSSLSFLISSITLLSLEFKAVNIDGENYWDGGYMGNPVLYPLIYNTTSSDIVIVHINPIERNNLPKTADEIANRVNEISFNTSLIKELRAIHFVQNMLSKNMLKDEYKKNFKNVLMHSIRADSVLSDLSVSSKLYSDWKFLEDLRDRGRAYAADWLKHNFKHLNVESSVDLAKEFL
jgi:NTE family protein